MQILITYGAQTMLRFGEHTIWSEEGVQQGDPLGPLIRFLNDSGKILKFRLSYYK